MVKPPPAMWEAQVGSLDWEDTLEKEMATHSSSFAWKFKRVGHDRVTSLSLSILALAKFSDSFMFLFCSRKQNFKCINNGCKIIIIIIIMVV